MGVDMESNREKMVSEHKVSETFGGYIRQITFNNGENFEVSPSDIVVFVGPNNAGKSQTLKDIYQLCEDSNNNSVVVSGIKIEKEDSSLKSYLEKFSNLQIHGPNKYYTGLSYSIYSGTVDSWKSNETYGEFRNFLIGYLTTLNRLTICEPAPNIRRDETYQSPIHYAAFNEKYQKKLSHDFERAFEKHIIPNQLFGSVIPLTIGDDVKIESDKESASSMIYSYAEKLALYPQVQNQGDGIKSFVGIMLYLMIDHYRTFLIDEPESFLHPPQAKIMGEIIGQTLSKHQQVFISTHSEEIVKGLLEVCPERVKMIRITRTGNANNFSILGNENFKKIWGDPLLRHSNIMASLFHKTVVLCESDSDCRLYSIIDSYLKQKEGHFSETMFIHCGGKQRMAKIVFSLKELNIDVKLVPDLDVLNDENIFKKITNSFGISWEMLERNYRILISNLGNGRSLRREEVRSAIETILNRSRDEVLSNKESKEIQEVVKTRSIWSDLKMSGVRGFPHGDAAVSFEQMNSILKEHGIYVVPVGELESFIPTVGGHGPNWVNSVLETYPDLENSIYNEIKEFIQSMTL